MDWLNRFNSAIDYIEGNLDNEIDYSYIAKIACCSEFHFSRMFSSLANVTLAGYVRRRRQYQVNHIFSCFNASIIFSFFILAPE